MIYILRHTMSLFCRFYDGGFDIILMHLQKYPRLSIPTMQPMHLQCLTDQLTILSKQFICDSNTFNITCAFALHDIVFTF